MKAVYHHPTQPRSHQSIMSMQGSTSQDNSPPVKPLLGQTELNHIRIIRLYMLCLCARTKTKLFLGIYTYTDLSQPQAPP